MAERERAGTDEQRISLALNEGGKGRLDVTVTADIENNELLPDWERSALYVSSLRLGIWAVWIHEHADCCRIGHELTQQLQSFCPDLAGEKAHARDVAARSVNARYEAVPDRVAPADEDDRHRRGCGFGGERRSNVADEHGHRPAAGAHT